MSAFVLVHGAFHGGWCWKRVYERLAPLGHRVYTPTLSGLADRSHLLSPQINLTTHINDVVNLILWEDLHDIVLCGHSYGGMVITGVAELLRDRIKSLVYLDALVPTTGQAVWDVGGRDQWNFLDGLSCGGGAYLRPLTAANFGLEGPDAAWIDEKCTPQPRASFIEPIGSASAVDQMSHKVYVLATRNDSRILHSLAAGFDFDPGWEVVRLHFEHELMIEAPNEVARILMHAAQEPRREREAINLR